MTRELLFSITKKDLVVTWYKSQGGGGQKKNKTANACRIQHPESGALVTAQERRERQQNLKAALNRLVDHPKFKIWHAKKCAETLTGKSDKEVVEQSMKPKNLKVEGKTDGRWSEISMSD